VYSLFNSRIIYFLKCAQMGSFSEVADKVGVTQSTMSTAIKKLEEELGAELFERTKAGISLTPRGRALMEQLQSFEKQINRGVAGALKEENPLPLKIGTAMHFGPKFLLPYLKTRWSQFPAIQLFFVWSLDAFKAVENGDLDFAFVSWSKRPKELPYIEIQPDPVAYVGLKKAFPNLNKVTTVEGLQSYPLIRDTKPQHTWEKILGPLESGFVTRGSMGARDLVLGGHAIGDLQLDIFSEEQLKTLHSAQIPGKYLHSHIYVVFRKDLSLFAKSKMEEMVLGLQQMKS